MRGPCARIATHGRLSTTGGDARRRDGRRSALRQRHARGLRRRRVELSPGADRRRAAAQRGRHRRRHAHLLGKWRAGAGARRGHLSQRADGQRRGGDRLFEVPRPRAVHRCAGVPRARRAGGGLRHPARRRRAAWPHLRAGPGDAFALHARGMIGNNSCGPHSVMAGTTVDNIERLEVLTYDGERFWCGPTSDLMFDEIVSKGGRQAEIYKKLKGIADKYGEAIRKGFPKIKRRVSGYNLDQLLPENGFNVARALVGSEGTCALTLQAEVRLVKSPPERVLVVLAFPDIYAAGDAVPRILAAKPIACEGLDEAIIGGLRQRGLRLDDIALLPPGKAWLMVEFGGETREEAVLRAAALGGGGVITDKAMIARLWTIRETGASATSLNLGGKGVDPVVGWEDAAVDPLRLGDYLREFQALVDRFGYRTSLYGHFGDGCIHARIDFDLRTGAGLEHWRKFLPEAARLVVKYGGSLSGEHGDGQAKGELLPIMFSPELMQAFREFKAAWDPRKRMNPGKLIDAYPVDANLRLGPDYHPLPLKTNFQFRSEVGNGFARAAEHCKIGR